VHDAAAGRHPLHVAGLDGATVALEVLVRHGALKQRCMPTQGEEIRTQNWTVTLILFRQAHYFSYQKSELPVPTDYDPFTSFFKDQTHTICLGGR
jgi:hypothetical protein